MVLKEIKNSWILSSGLIGCENQCLGVIERLGIETEIKKIKPSMAVSLFAPYGTPFLNPQVREPWPDLVIAAGRKTIPYLKYIRKASKKECKTIYLQDPRIDSKEFDIVWAPEHDSIEGSNIIKTITSPNRVTNELLNYHHDEWLDKLSKLKGPFIGFLIGGKSKAYNFNDAECEKIIQALNFVISNGYTPLITLSRRSPKKLSNRIKNLLINEKNLFYDGQGDNPYFAILKASEIIITTPDSANMISEAINVPKPVYYIDIKSNSKRFNKFINTLVNSGHIRPFENNIDYFQNKKLDPTKEIVDYIYKNLF
ncbi:MAG: mitochondrial fission ELM1 family protein [Alphaproteobacteria bacterium]